MKIMRHLGIMVLSLSLLGWVVACSGTNTMMDNKMDSQMEPKMDSMLSGSDGHHASGKVSFGMGMNNKHVLTLSDIKVDKVPDGYVYLTKNGDRMHGVELGMLKQFSGTVSFDLPAGINPDDYDSVVIWCKNQCRDRPSLLFQKNDVRVSRILTDGKLFDYLTISPIL